MNIGIFTDSYLPQISGVVNSVIIFKEELERLGHRVYIFAPKMPKYNEKEKDVFRFRSISMGRLFTGKGKYIANRLAIPLSIRNFFKMANIKLDIVHSQTEMGMGALATFYAIFKKIPHIHTYHTLYSEYVHYLAKGRLISPKAAEKLSAMYCNQCDLIIAPSQRIKDLLWKYGVKKRIEVLETGVDISQFALGKKHIVREKYEIDSRVKLMLYVGRLGKEKRVDIILWAFAAANVENSKIMLVGDGPEKENLEKMAKELGIQDKVIFTGYLTYDQMPDIYAAADIFLFSSITETQGMVLLEASAAGLPIVAIEDEVVKQYVINGKNGFLVSGDAKDLAESIRVFFSNPWEASKMSNFAKQLVSEYTVQRQTQKLLEIYEQMVNK